MYNELLMTTYACHVQAGSEVTRFPIFNISKLVCVQFGLSVEDDSIDVCKPRYAAATLLVATRQPLCNRTVPIREGVLRRVAAKLVLCVITRPVAQQRISGNQVP